MQKEQARLTGKRFLLPFILITALFFLWGFARAILDVLNKHLQNEMEISITQSALIQVTTFLGYFLMAIPAGILINRRGYRQGVVLGLLLFAAGSLLFVPGTWLGSFWAFLLALFVIGCGLVFLETAANPYVTELGPASTATSRLNLSQSFNGLGSLFATFAVGQFFFREGGEAGNVALPYTVLGVIVLLIAFVFSRVDLPEIVHDDPNAPAQGLRNLSEPFRRPLFVFGLVALLSYEVAEISINSYFINFVTGMGWMDDNLASVILTCALALFMVGRFLGSWVMKWIRPEQMLLLCALGTVVSVSLVLCDLGRCSLLTLLGIYFFEAIMFPTIFSLALRGLGNLTKSAASLLMMTPVGGCGFLLMGWMADGGKVQLPFLIPLLGFLVVLAYSVRIMRERK